MAITTTPQTLPKVLDVVGEGPFDLLDPFGRVFWKNLTPKQATDSARKMGVLYRVVPVTGLETGQKVVA